MKSPDDLCVAHISGKGLKDVSEFPVLLRDAECFVSFNFAFESGDPLPFLFMFQYKPEDFKKFVNVVSI